MAVVLNQYLKAIAQSENPKAEIKKWCGNLKDLVLSGDRVMVATYARPEKTEGGIYLSDAVQIEDRFQGAVGCLVAKGPAAFKYDGAYKFEGDEPPLFSWVIFRPADGYEIAWRKASCRIFRSESIFGVIKSPELVY